VSGGFQGPNRTKTLLREQSKEDQWWRRQSTTRISPLDDIFCLLQQKMTQLDATKDR